MIVAPKGAPTSEVHGGPRKGRVAVRAHGLDEDALPAAL